LTYQFSGGNLLLLNATTQAYVGLLLTPGPSTQLVSNPTPAQTASIVQGALQITNGVQTAILAFTGPANAPVLTYFSPSNITPNLAIRQTITDLQLPNITSGGYHSIYAVSGVGGQFLAYGPNVP
jgi:hypothetical protein